MKRYFRTVLLAVIGLMVLLLATCMLPSVSISDRISMFVDSLNSDRSSTYKNLDPAIPAYSGSSPAYWDSLFAPADEPFSFSPNPPNTSNSSDVEVTILGGNGYSTLHKFIMVNVGTGSDDWRIHGLQYSTNGGLNWTAYF